MYRTLEDYLTRWKSDPFRLPLILRGARQVGKSFMVQKLGTTHFQQFIEVNFEEHSDAADLFEELNPEAILAKLELAYAQKIIPGETLIFLDEIQAFPKALHSLRYFKEKRPDIHIIAAGSLLEFCLQEHAISFPVGRVAFVHLGPMSFKEFLIAAKETPLLDALSNATLQHPPSTIAHKKALKLFQVYSFTGGMPAVVERYIATGSYLEAKDSQATLLQGYQHDFLKYKARANVELLTKVFNKAPRLIRQHFKYTHIDREIRSREIKKVLEQLCWAGVISRITATRANGLPLKSDLREHRFKLLMLDVGLLQNALNVDYQAMFKEGILHVHTGILAEQVVGQELLCLQHPQAAELFFWEKETRGSAAEIDYLMSLQGKMIPIEVKAGRTGRLLSLRTFMEEKKADIGVVISLNPLSKKNGVLNLPFYMIGALGRFTVY